MHPILFKIGPLTFYTYGFFVFLGILCGYLFALKESRRYGIEKDKVSDLLFWALLSGFISARLLYIVINWKDFLDAPLGFILSGSGFVFYGGLVGGVLSLCFFIKKYKLSFLKTLDLLAPALSLGHSLGRIGCFFYGCCYGKPASSFIGIAFPPGSPAGYMQLPVIPTQLISSFFIAVIFVILLVVRDKKFFKGAVFLSYISLYSIFRFIIEFYRGDERGFFLFFSISQWLSLIFLVFALIAWFTVLKHKIKRT